MLLPHDRAVFIVVFGDVKSIGGRYRERGVLKTAEEFDDFRGGFNDGNLLSAFEDTAEGAKDRIQGTSQSLSFYRDFSCQLTSLL